MIFVFLKMNRLIGSILVTGGCGFIASNLVDWLLVNTEVQKVVVLDNLSEGSNLDNISQWKDDKRFLFFKGEFGNKELVLSILREQEIDCIMHLAGETHVDRSYIDPQRCCQINVCQTISLLEACREYAKLTLFFYMSTDEVYGDYNPLPNIEDTILHPTNPYAASKAAAEQFVHAYSVSYSIPTVTVRSNNVYGPKQSVDKVVPRFVSLLLKGSPITIHGTGEQKRNWIHVSDVCRAIWLVATRGKNGTTFNIGSNDEISILELAQVIHSILSKEGLLSSSGEANLVFQKDRPHNDAFYRINWTKISTELEWKPLVSFQEGIVSTVKSFIKNRSSDCIGGTKFLIYGHAGWIGGQFVQLLGDTPFSLGASRPGDDLDSEVEKEVSNPEITHVVSLLGRTYGPGYTTIDYLEGGPDKTRLNVRDNLYAPTLLALLCKKYGKHLTYLGTGCIFEYEDASGHSLGSGKGYTEEDIPNFFKSSYSVVKGFTDRLMHNLSDTVLNVRIRMPVSNQVNGRNFITKIAGYKQVVNIPNSVTVLPELLPLMIDMAKKKRVGTINLVNPGAISHNQVLGLYQKYIDPEFVINNFTAEEQSKILKAGRSNCELDASKLQSLYPESVNSSLVAVENSLREMSVKQ